MVLKISWHMEVLTKNEAPVMFIFSGKRVIGLQILVYFYQAKFFKRRIGPAR
jgi:hypothetical protein